MKHKFLMNALAAAARFVLAPLHAYCMNPRNGLIKCAGTDNTAILGNDAIIYVSDNFSSPVGVSPGNAWKEIGNAMNIQFDNGTSTKVDVTHLRSPGKEFRSGKPDPGSLTFEVFTDMGDPGQLECMAARADGEKRYFKIVLAEGTNPVWTAVGTVAKFDKAVNTDTPFKSSVEVYIVGAWENSAS